ncbi:MAG: hypothetical protein QXP60_00960 [Nitrososphaerota archaeon]
MIFIWHCNERVKVKQTLTSAIWILILVITLTIIGLWIILLWNLHYLPLLSVLVLLALISGIIDTFTTINDNRITSFRVKTINCQSIKWDENSGFLTPAELVAWRGLIGTIFSMLFLLFAYAYLGIPINRILTDLLQSSQLDFLGFPAFIIAGILTIISTLAYLNIVKESPIYMVPTKIITSILVMNFGMIIFKDSIIHFLLLFLLFIFSTVFYYFFEKTRKQWSSFQESLECKLPMSHEKEVTYPNWILPLFRAFKKIPFIGYILIVIICDTLRFIIIRVVIGPISEEESFIIGMNFRTAYFSLFIFYTLLYIPIIYQSYKRLKFLDMLKREFQRISILMLTSFTLVCSYALNTGVYGKNLAMSPLLSLTTFILFTPICSAWYFINSSQPSFKQRFYQILGKVKPDLSINRIAASLYIISFVLCLVWLVCWLLAL